MDETVYVIYVPHGDIPTSLLWLEPGDPDGIHEDWYDATGNHREAVIRYDIIEPDQVLPRLYPNYSRISWMSCCECGAISWLDYLCPECRDGVS